MKSINEEVLIMVEAMGGTGFALEEIAEVIEWDPTEFATAYNAAGSDIKKRYRKGYLLAKLSLRQRIFKDAGYGSSPAQTMAKNIMDNCEFKLSSE